MGSPDIVRKGDRMGRRPQAPSTGTPGPSGPLQVVALPPCPICGLPAGLHRPPLGAPAGSDAVCPEQLATATAGPEAWLPSEGTLLRLLKRHYGWIQPEASQLVRPRR
jgi:hypothetical protein